MRPFSSKGLSLALIAAGVVLLSLGVRAQDSARSSLSRFSTGSPTDNTIWMLIGGGAALIVGLALMTRSATRGA